MKKYILIASAALLTLASCTKVMETAANSDEIGFQVANYAQTKADGDATPTVAFTHDDFGAYAWHNGDQGAQTVRFSNEKVAKRDGVWTTVNATYYWMKTGTDDFVCYAPYNEGTPEVTPTSIKWGVAAPYEVKMDSKDLMYADKALNQTGKVGQDGKTAAPVPVLFHHALAKLAFQVKANFLEYTNPEEKDDKGNVVVASGKTTWEVTLRSAKLSGIRNKGSIELKTPDASGKWTLPEGKVWTPDREYIPNSGSLDLSLKEDNSSWNLPEVEGYHVWDYAKSTTDDLNLYQKSGTDAGLALTTEPQRVYTDENGEFVPLFVIPQILMSTDYESEDWTVGQQLVMDLTIVTHLPGNPDDSGKPLVITENIHKVYDLKDISPLKAWEMNQDITYTINIKPTASSDPGNPDDPKDVIITFDPAVDDWVPVSSPIEIAL